jgi:uncharacterized protein YfbU (UPF0304 family)
MTIIRKYDHLKERNTQVVLETMNLRMAFLVPYPDKDLR